jgi:copper(I)-binding protein
MNIVTKDLILAVWSLIAGTALVGAQPTSAPPASAAPLTNALGPRIQFATPVYDFGRARAGEPVKYTYVFTNTGDRMLIVNSVQPGCHCTTAGEWTKQVEPGQTGGIPVQFDTTGGNGMTVRQITVACNITNLPPMVYIQLKGMIYKPVDVNPPWAVLNVPPDSESASLNVTITNNTEEPLILSPPESNNRMFSAQLVTNQPGRGYLLKVTAVPMGVGSVQGQIHLKTTWTNTPVIQVMVVANVQPAVMVMPSFMSLAPGPLPNAVTNSVTIQNNSTNLLTLSEPVVNMPGVEATIRELQPGKSFAAMLAFPQGFLVPPGQQVELSVKSSNPRFPVLKVPVMQLARPTGPAVPVRPAASVRVPVSAPVQATPPVLSPSTATTPPAPAVTPVVTAKNPSPTGARSFPAPPPLPPLPPAPK